MKSSKVTSRTLVVFWSILEAWSRPVKKCRQCWSTCGGCHSMTRSIEKLTFENQAADGALRLLVEARDADAT